MVRWGFTISLWFALATSLRAGGGPENVFLVVNSASSDSLAIANHFADWRKVPAACVFNIDWPNAPRRTDINTFRQRMLGPILQEIKRRKLNQQIDYIIYSSGFPYAVDFSADLDQQQAKFAIASITSLTYLHEWVMKEDASYRGAVNRYARNLLPNAGGKSQGFRARYGIDSMGLRSQENDGNPHYFLSMLLASTQGAESNTLPEVLRYLMQGIKADGTQPEGTIYFVRNANIRSKVRHNLFADVVAELKELGVNAEEIEGTIDAKNCLPVGKQDVMGAMIGFFKFIWSASGSRILPGAICENFTSWGGALDGTHTKQQTLLCEFLRFGAVASSGTVTEPFAILQKFPHPRMHVHYARGCSVAEAYYQSVSAPYQLIIVGDPLCQPWAVAPEIVVSGLNTKEPLSGTQALTVSATSKSGRSIRNFEIFIDGVLLVRVLPGKPIKLDTRKLANGYHELRVVGIEESRVETQGRFVTAFVSMNDSNDAASAKPRGVTSQVVPASGKIRAGAIGYVKLQSRGARELRLYKGRDLIGTVLGESGQIRFTAAQLGGGPSHLTPVAIPKTIGAKPIFGFPVDVTVQLGG